MPDLPWKKSTKSASGDCVEVAITAAAVHVRNTRDRQGPMLTFGPDEWQGFIDGLKNR
ncbi:DUF397 domain-containing protein [Nonomuraea fuscirosea]|uniref:DUF397 domain-containing protein n=1 Tax=Nonomuraea fuscirosea TaxID=1291556 RepID=UPI0033D83F37